MGAPGSKQLARVLPGQMELKAECVLPDLLGEGQVAGGQTMGAIFLPSISQPSRAGVVGWGWGAPGSPNCINIHFSKKQTCSNAFGKMPAV